MADTLLFYRQVARLKIRPVESAEAEGCINIACSRYAPTIFRSNRLLDLLAGGEFIDHSTVQESMAAVETN